MLVTIYGIPRSPGWRGSFSPAFRRYFTILRAALMADEDWVRVPPWFLGASPSANNLRHHPGCSLEFAKAVQNYATLRIKLSGCPQPASCAPYPHGHEPKTQGTTTLPGRVPLTTALRLARMLKEPLWPCCGGLKNEPDPPRDAYRPSPGARRGHQEDLQGTDPGRTPGRGPPRAKWRNRPKSKRRDPLVQPQRVVERAYAAGPSKFCTPNLRPRATGTV